MATFVEIQSHKQQQLYEESMKHAQSNQESLLSQQQTTTSSSNEMPSNETNDSVESRNNASMQSTVKVS